MAYKYCYLCGGQVAAVSANGETHWRCPVCGQTFFDNPKPAAEIVLVTEKNTVVVVVRARDPHKGKFDLPGGFINSGETVEQGLERELVEELGLKASDYTQPIYLFSAVDQYPWGQEIHTVVTSPFTARLSSSLRLEAQDDVEKILYLAPDKLRSEYFAWESQYPIILAAIEYWAQPNTSSNALPTSG